LKVVKFQCQEKVTLFEIKFVQCYHKCPWNRTAIGLCVVICQIVNVPYIERPCEATTSAGVEYQEDDVQDHVYQAVLHLSYNTFRVGYYFISYCVHFAH